MRRRWAWKSIGPIGLWPVSAAASPTAIPVTLLMRAWLHSTRKQGCRAFFHFLNWDKSQFFLRHVSSEKKMAKPNAGRRGAFTAFQHTSALLPTAAATLAVKTTQGFRKASADKKFSAAHCCGWSWGQGWALIMAHWPGGVSYWRLNSEKTEPRAVLLYVRVCTEKASVLYLRCGLKHRYELQAPPPHPTFVYQHC